jgi:hypothetical protein
VEPKAHSKKLVAGGRLDLASAVISAKDRLDKKDEVGNAALLNASRTERVSRLPGLAQ